MNIMPVYCYRNQSFGQIKHIGQDPTAEPKTKESQNNHFFKEVRFPSKHKNFLPLSFNLLLWDNSFPVPR